MSTTAAIVTRGQLEWAIFGMDRWSDVRENHFASPWRRRAIADLIGAQMFGTTTSTMTSFAESLEDDAFGFSAARATAPLTCLDDVLEDLDEVIEGWFNGDGGDDAATDIV